MAYTRRIRFEYYSVTCRKKDDAPDEKDREFDFEGWIQKAGRLSLEARTYDYYQEQARLDRLQYDDRSNLWCMSFVRLRETNIPTKGKLDRETEPMELEEDEYISEDAAAIYDHHLKVIMLQRNRYSLGPKGIEEYLNLLWGDDDVEIYLRPIPPRDILEKARGASQYRKMTIRFSDLSKVEGSFGSLDEFIEGFGKYEAVTAEITVTMGHTKGTSLNPETVRDSISHVMGNGKVITKAELGIKIDDDSSVEIVDLFEDKVHKFIFIRLERRQSLISDFLFDRMIETHREAMPELLASIGGQIDGEEGRVG